MLIPQNFEVNLKGSDTAPIPVKITVGEKVFFLGVGLIVVILLSGLKKRK